MKIESLYRKARAAHPTMKADHALSAARHYIAGPLSEYRAKLAAWESEPDKRRYAPGGSANRPTFPEFCRIPPEPALREVEKPRWLDHDGWYTDAEQGNVLRPHVWRLTHGRMVAGYEDSAWGTVQLDRVAYDDEREAWHAADALAERDAECEREHSERWDAASKANDYRADALQELKAARADARQAIAAIREQRKIGGIAPTMCKILQDTIATARDEMRHALETIADKTAEIENLGMQGEF